MHWPVVAILPSSDADIPRIWDDVAAAPSGNILNTLSTLTWASAKWAVRLAAAVTVPQCWKARTRPTWRSTYRRIMIKFTISIGTPTAVYELVVVVALVTQNNNSSNSSYSLSSCRMAYKNSICRSFERCSYIAARKFTKCWLSKCFNRDTVPSVKRPPLLKRCCITLCIIHYLSTSCPVTDFCTTLYISHFYSSIMHKSVHIFLCKIGTLLLYLLTVLWVYGLENIVWNFMHLMSSY